MLIIIPIRHLVQCIGLKIGGNPFLKIEYREI